MLSLIYLEFYVFVGVIWDFLWDSELYKILVMLVFILNYCNKYIFK